MNNTGYQRVSAAVKWDKSSVWVSGLGEEIVGFEFIVSRKQLDKLLYVILLVVG